MRLLIIVSAMLFSNIALAATTYNCSAKGKDGVLRIVDTRFAEPRIDFYPTGDRYTDDKRKMKQVYVSDLAASDNKKLSGYVMTKKSVNLGAAKFRTSVYFQKELLQGADTVRVVYMSETLSFRNKVMNRSTSYYTCRR